MTSLLLHKILNYILVITVFLLVIWFVYMRYNKGQDLEEKLAGSICAKLIYENISKNFQITNVVYDNFHRINDSMVSLYITYNGKTKTTSDCIFLRNYKNKILLKQALLVDENGKLRVYENIEILVNNK